MAVCQVCETTLYYRGLPASGGLLDPLMGTVDRRHLCATCQNDPRGCQGHPGYMALSFPMYHIGFIDTVLKILRVTCFCCSRICLTDEEVASLDETSGRSRLASIHNAFRTRKTCPHCDMVRPVMARVSLGIKVTWPADMRWESDEEETYCTSPFTARDALSILRNIPPDDLAVMGFSPKESHPKNMIIQNMVVPPPCTRPAVYSSEGSRSRGQNDLTMRLLEVLKRSHEVSNFLGPDTWRTIPVVTADLMERLLRLQYEVFMLVNNNARIAKPAGMGRNSSNANGKSIHDRLKGKEGRVRGNLMGKRVDFSARCVITPDAWFECDRVGVPHRIAMTLTFPETVNSENIRHLSERVRIGTTNVGGAQNVIHTDGCVTDLGTCGDRTSIVLRPGDVVERFIADDDVVVFNRQPSLHMHGMQAHRVRLMPGHTFRLSLIVAAPYNADFDGDEMNLHVPQSKAASAECAALMAVAQNTLGSQSNRPVMGIVQDSLLGLYLMTQSSTLFDHAHACRIIGHIRHAPRRLPPPAVYIYGVNGTRRALWTGRQLFSLILPPTLYVENDAMLADLDSTSSEAWLDPPVTVRGGELVTGVLQKAHVGTGAGGIVDTICREMDGVMCMRFMGDAQRITHEFLLQRGHHVGIHDVMLSHDGHVQVMERLEKATTLCEEIQREIVHGTPHERQQGEDATMRLLSKTLLQTGGIVNEYMDATNSIRRMVTAGSKGSFINLSQICAALGQQSLEGGRIVAEKGTRTLPCFAHNDISLASRGMVQNSFSLGLSPPELFFHAIGGREGLVDTAVKTSQSGYISRRMNKSMEDNVVRPGGVICTSMDDIIAPQWGSDGFHPARVERVKLVELTESETSIRSRMSPTEADMVLHAVGEIRLCKFHPLTGDGDARVLLPYNTGRMRRIMHRARTPTGGCDSDDVQQVMSRIFQLVRDAPNVVVASLVGFINSHTLPLVPRAVVDDLVSQLEQRIEYARSTACESVGCIAAQSISERGTQLSVAADTMVLVRRHGAVQSVAIGSLIDDLLPPLTDPTCQHDVLPVENLHCVGVSETENVAWANVTHVSRHPANGDMLTVHTSRGRCVTATASHSFLIRTNNRVVATPGSTLRVGDMLPIVKDLPTNAGGSVPDDCPFELTTELGRLIGAVVADGAVYSSHRNADDWSTDGEWCRRVLDDFETQTGVKTCLKRVQQHPNAITEGTRTHAIVNHTVLSTWMRVHFGYTSHTTVLPGWILDAPDCFVTALLQTYFDGDGNIQTHGEDHVIRCHSGSKPLLVMVSLCLARYGIPSSHMKHAYCTSAGVQKTMHMLTISCCYARTFRTHIGFLRRRKSDLLDVEVELHSENKRTEHATYIPGMEDVFERARPYIDGVNVRREVGVTSSMLLRLRMQAEIHGAPPELLAEFDIALEAHVWWDPITDIEVHKNSTEMVYDFTVQEDLQSFMLTNGLFVHNTLNSNTAHTCLPLPPSPPLSLVLSLSPARCLVSLAAFHSAGVSVKNVTLGIPRFKEILDASKTPKTPCTTLRFVDPFRSSATFAEYMANTLPLTRLSDIVNACNIFHDPDPNVTVVVEDRWIVEADQILGYSVPDHSSNLIVRIELLQEVMRSRHLTPTIVRHILSERLTGRALVSSSEANSLDWIIRIRFHHLKDMVAHGNLGSEQEAILCHRALNVLLDTVVISGHPKITGANASEDSISTGCHVVHAYGNVLLDASASESVDWERCTSNDMWEVYHTLGIEAAAHVIFEQMKAVVAFDGTYVDDRHILLIVDNICRAGSIMPLNRHGINKTDNTSPLMRCSFEETMDVLCEAAGFAQSENARGVSTSIMTGQLANMGTGACQVLFPQGREVRTIQSIQTSGRVMRSSCRSYTARLDEETLEYVTNQTRPSGMRPLSPPTVDERGSRKRARFRMVSPTR